MEGEVEVPPLAPPEYTRQVREMTDEARVTAKREIPIHITWIGQWVMTIWIL